MIMLYKIMFINSLLLGTLISISAYSWFSAWIGLEINLLSIIPLMKNYKNKYSSEATLKYFITQVMGSSFLLLSILIFLKTKDPIQENFDSSELILFSSALLLKMGAAPFHFWLPEVMSGLNWSSVFMLATWQKITPMLLLSLQTSMHNMFFSIIIISSSMISGIQGLNQVCLRKIIAYSSINHVGWMISSLLFSLNIWYIYMLIYSFINLNIILILKKFNILYLNQLSYVFTFSKKMKFLFSLNFLSLGGLPPFLGFFPKWITINGMINNNYYLTTTILIVLSLISLYFYLRISFSSFTLYTSKSLIILFNKTNYYHFFINAISLMGMIICSMVDYL